MTCDQRCPLCEAGNSQQFFRDKQRPYLQCQVCHLIFVPEKYLLSLQEEKAVYDCHENSPADAAYRKFLSRLWNPLKEKLSASDSGLDFGSGPGPTLSVMAKEAGFSMAVYDPFYANDESVLKNTYDFITMTEVIEHVFQPAVVLKQLWPCLRSEGYLAIMTKLVVDQQRFAQWHYKNDPTHVRFYSQATFFWLAKQLKAEVEFIAADVIFLKKQ